MQRLASFLGELFFALLWKLQTLSQSSFLAQGNIRKEAAYKGTKPSPPTAVAVVWAEETVHSSAINQLVDILRWCKHDELESFCIYDPSGEVKAWFSELQKQLSDEDVAVQIGWRDEPIGNDLVCESCRPKTLRPCTQAADAGTLGNGLAPAACPGLQQATELGRGGSASGASGCPSVCAKPSWPKATKHSAGQNADLMPTPQPSLVPAAGRTAVCTDACGQLMCGCGCCSGIPDPTAAPPPAGHQPSPGPSTCAEGSGPELARGQTAGCDGAEAWCSDGRHGPAEHLACDRVPAHAAAVGNSSDGMGADAQAACGAFRPCSSVRPPCNDGTAPAGPRKPSHQARCDLQGTAARGEVQPGTARAQASERQGLAPRGEQGSPPLPPHLKHGSQGAQEPGACGSGADSAQHGAQRRSRRVCVHLLSAEDGYEPVLQAARTGGVCATCGAVTPLKGGTYREGLARLRGQMEQLAGPRVLVQPELVLVVGPVLTLAGYPPFQVATSEILHLGPSRDLCRARVDAAWAKFLRTEQRFGT